MTHDRKWPVSNAPHARLQNLPRGGSRRHVEHPRLVSRSDPGDAFGDARTPMPTVNHDIRRQSLDGDFKDLALGKFPRLKFETLASDRTGARAINDGRVL